MLFRCRCLYNVCILLNNLAHFEWSRLFMWIQLNFLKCSQKIGAELTLSPLRVFAEKRIKNDIFVDFAKFLCKTTEACNCLSVCLSPFCYSSEVILIFHLCEHITFDVKHESWVGKHDFSVSQNFPNIIQTSLKHTTY